MKQYLAFLSLAILLVACGDENTEVTQINQMGMDIVGSVKDLPECTDDNEGEQALVKGETSIRVCVDGKWFATKSDDAFEFSCKTEELKDGSGLKIVCNGDSIGVVLNGAAGQDGKPGKDGKPGETGKDGNEGKKGDTGANGEDGKDGAGCSISARTETTVSITCGDSVIVIDLGVHSEASTDTVELDSEKIVTNLESLDGYTQKGPFLKGSTVYLYELSDGRTLRQTNGNFMSYITSDDGRYQFNARNLVSQYAMVVVDGNYRNEVTGKNSERPIRLRAITEMTERSSANVNLLTNLEFDRVYYLVTQKKMKVRNAKKQAQAEIFKAFHIDTTGFSKSSEDLDVFGTSDADAALLAISILLQGDSSETALSVLLTEISNDMATDGKWDGPNSDSIKAAIADWAAAADSALQDTASRLFKFRGNVSGWGLGNGSVPAFEKFIRKFWSIENGLGVCGEGDNSVGVVKHVPNEKSGRYYAAAYDDVTKAKTRFICANAGSVRWRAATDIEKDTVGLGQMDHVSDDIVHGVINADMYYVFEKGHWSHGTFLDSVVTKGCVKDRWDTVAKGKNGEWYTCDSALEMTAAGSSWKGAWRVSSDIEKDTAGLNIKCGASSLYRDGRLVPGFVNNDKYYVCDGNGYRTPTDDEQRYGMGCTSYNRDALIYRNGGYLKCGSSGWASVVSNPRGVVTDTRDGWVYATTGIDGKVWMAENLNYETVESHCYRDSSKYCYMYGRLYTWGAAIGKSNSECNNTSNCGVAFEKIQGACPNGWHLPDSTDYKELITFAGGNRSAGDKLRSTTDWAYVAGKDDYGFGVLPAGYGNTLHTISGEAYFLYYDVRVGANFWASNRSSSGKPSYFYIEHHVSGFSGDYYSADLSSQEWQYLYSIRCIQNDYVAP